MIGEMPPDPDTLRAEMRSGWERVAGGWDRQADQVRAIGMPVSMWMIDHLGLQPGQRVLELAAGPGDTGFLAAELIQPGGTLISSDGAEAMLDVARRRAQSLGLENVEFKQLELEWIDLPTASVDAILCRWALMLTVDRAAALQEMRRVLAPGGHIALAVWDGPEGNVWATAPNAALVELGFAQPPDPNAPGMFTLARPGVLQEMLESAGFVDVVVEGVDIDRTYSDLDDYLAELFDLSQSFTRALEGLSVQQRAAVRRRIAEELSAFTREDGSLWLRGRSLVAAAGA
jgi:ubiquinone/menaquinone biosynthesis C-methylase UbiE